MMGTALMIFSTATNFKRAYLKHGHAIPEERLPPMIVGSIILPISLFWFAWTSMPSISWVPSVLATAFLGMSCLVTFWQGMNYIIVSPSVSPQLGHIDRSLMWCRVGRVRILCEFGDSGQHFCAIDLRRRVPVVRGQNVSRTRCAVGDVVACVLVRGIRAGADIVL